MHRLLDHHSWLLFIISITFNPEFGASLTARLHLVAFDMPPPLKMSTRRPLQYGDRASLLACFAPSPNLAVGLVQIMLRRIKRRILTFGNPNLRLTCLGRSTTDLFGETCILNKMRSRICGLSSERMEGERFVSGSCYLQSNLLPPLLVLTYARYRAFMGCRRGFILVKGAKTI